MKGEINAKQDRFAREYVVDYNATHAAIRAGYSARTAGVQAFKLLKIPRILARVKELQAEQRERLAITADWTVLKLVECVQKSMQETPVMEFDFSTRKLEPTGEYQYDSRGATRALELLGKHLGMFEDKMRLTGALPVVIAGAEQLED